MDIWSQLPIVLWAIFYTYWIVSAANVKQTQRHELNSSRVVHLALLAVAFALVGIPELRIGPLANRFLPDSRGIQIAGLLIEAAGLGFAIWARYHLGQYWSGIIAIKEGHKLIRTGPYAWVRHPIYTGITVGLLGSAIWIGEWGALLGVALLAIAYLRKISQEERFLDQEFGMEYDQYRHEVKALIPLVL
jgi:protein-S-isoprenylcysteine O-methyltransferase Ste14